MAAQGIIRSRDHSCCADGGRFGTLGAQGIKADDHTAPGSPDKSMLHIACVPIRSRDHSRLADSGGAVPFDPMGSKAVRAPLLLRKKPCSTLLASTKCPVIVPCTSIPTGTVKSEPGTKKVFMVPSGARTNPCSATSNDPVIAPAALMALA